MLARNVRFAVAPLLVAALIPMAAGTAISKEKTNDSDGRAGNWHSSAQGAPSVEACRKKVTANPQDAEAQNDLGWALRQNGDEKGAEEALRASMQLNGKSPYAHSNLSVVLLDTKRVPEALTEAKMAVSLDDSQPVFHVVLGNAYDANEDRKNAIEQYRQALKLKPDYENAMYNLGRLLNDDGQVNEAKMTLAEALKLDPNDDRVMKILDTLLQ